jgi:hypothetical protein
MNSIGFLYILVSAFINRPGCYGVVEGGVVIDNGTLTINGNPIDKTWSHESFTNALGKEEREYSRVDIYDSKGIMLWNKYKSDADNDTSITEFKTVFQLDGYGTADWFCNQPFKDKVIVEGNLIDMNTGYNDLVKALPMYHFATSGSTGWYDGVYKDIYIYAQFTDSLDQLIYLAIGLDEGDNYRE